MLTRVDASDRSGPAPVLVPMPARRAICMPAGEHAGTRAGGAALWLNKLSHGTEGDRVW